MRAGMKPAAVKPPAGGMGKPPAGGAKAPIGQAADNRPRTGSGPGGPANGNQQKPLSPPTAARGAPQRAISPPGPRPPLASEHKNSQASGLRADPKNKAAYGTIIRNWGSNQAGKANLSMIEKKNLFALLALHRNNNVKVQSVASEVIDSLVELPDGSIAMDSNKVNGFRPLIDLSKRDDIDADIPVLVVQALASLAGHPACRVPILTEVGWFNIPKFARAPEADMKMACATLLGNLSHEEKNQKVIIEKGVPLLLENLKEASTPELKCTLLSAFADLARIKDYGAQKIWDESFLQFIVPSVMNDASPDEQVAAVALLSNVSDTQNTSVHNEIISSGLIDKLYTLLKSENDDLQGNVALTFARIGKSDVGMRKFESLHSFKNLVERLTSSSKNSNIQYQIAGALDVLADSDTIKVLLKKEECVEALEEVILSTSTHEQVEALALVVLKKLDIEYSKIVVDKLSHTHKERPPMVPLVSETTVETTLHFSPPSSPRAVDIPPQQEVVAAVTSKPAAAKPAAAKPAAAKPAAPSASDVPPPRKQSVGAKGRPLSSHSGTGQPLEAFAVGQMDATRMQKDHESEVVKLQEEKKRLEELLRKEREAERESNKYTVASPGSNIDDKIKGSLKSIQESINLEVDLLGAEKGKIEEWKRAIENYKGDRIIYEKDLEILRKDQQHLQQERGSFAGDIRNLEADKQKIERERNSYQDQASKFEKENARLKQEADALAKLKEKFERDRQDFERERELLSKGNADQSAIDRERAERERLKAEAAEKAREQAEHELQRADRERREMEEMLEKERRKFREELENERRRADEERERAASAANAATVGESKERHLAEKEKYFEEIQLTFEKDKKRLEKEKAMLEEELARQREANGQSADEAARISEFQKAIQLLEETVEESKKMNKTLGSRVEELEDELRRKREEGTRDRGNSDVEESQKAWLELEKRRLAELARKLEADQEELERRRREKDENKEKDGDGVDDLDLDLDERERKQIAKDLKRLEEWELAKEKEKEEAKRRLDEEIEILKQRHMSWERKKAIVMADLIEKENAIFEREAGLQKIDDELYQREVKVADLENRPARRELYDEYSSDESRDRTEITHSDDDYDGRERRRSFGSADSWSDTDQTITESVASSDEDRKPKKSSKDREREREREERDREREKELEYERERAREREREKERDRERERKRKQKEKAKAEKVLKSSKGSTGMRGSTGLKSSTSSPKPRPPFGDMEQTEDEVEDDEDDIFSVEGLAHSDPYEAARKLLALLELDPTRANESTMDALRKFSKNRSGAPTQYEARDIIPALIHILKICTPQSHEEIINICLLILAILAYNKDANQLYIRRAKGYDTYEIFLGCPLASVQARAALAIAAYALNNVPIKNEIGQTCVPKLVLMLKDLNPIIKKSGATALASLVDNNKFNKKVVKKLDGIKLLMELMKDNQIPPKYSLHLLASLAHESKTIKRDAPKHFPNVFRKIVLLLSPYTRASVLVAAVACLVELARNNPHNQKEIHKAGATNYLVTILSNKDKYNNSEDLIANTLFLCWVIAKVCPKGLANPDFDSGKKSMVEIFASLQDIRNPAIQKIISNMQNMIRTAETAKGVLGSPSPYPPSPQLGASAGVRASGSAASSPVLASSSGASSSVNASGGIASSSSVPASPDPSKSQSPAIG